MHVLHLYKDYPPVLGGIENHIRMLAEAQTALGHEVTVLVCSRDRRTYEERLNGVRVIRAGRLATAVSMPLSWRQPLILARLQADIAHVHSPYPLGEVANWLWGRAQATVITHHSDIVRQRAILCFYGPILRRVLRAADAIIATSPCYLESSPWLQPVRDRCTVVPLGVDLSRFTVPARHMHTPPTLLFVGKLRYYKGLDTLLRAMPQVPQARLVIVGDGPMREVWQRLAAQLRLEPRVQFVGEVSDVELPSYYANADLFVLPANARAEAFGTVLLEAMASGLPVISTELGTGTSWVNQDGVTGRVVPPGDPDTLAAVLRELLAAPSQLVQMGKAARARVEAEFSLSAMVRRVEAVYQQALHSPNRERSYA
ncbi:MAG: glycosyltransferase [Anaerolineae bacterium]|nr:glycosyltransferase [Anaerolineae bacterium]MDW8098725.1 glycosyltransferase [Anaerolineae bacterium]